MFNSKWNIFAQISHWYDITLRISLHSVILFNLFEKSLAFDHFRRKRQSKLLTQVQIEFEYWIVCGATWKQRRGWDSREASVCPTIGVSRRSPPGKSRISLRSDAFPPDSWPTLGLWLADGRGIASAPPLPLSIRDPFRYAARNYGPCVSRGHPSWFVSLPKPLW